jgi:ABC-type transport system involved in Fe-S cluster assembly fused permease/ATPase subunit
VQPAPVPSAQVSLAPKGLLAATLLFMRAGTSHLHIATQRQVTGAVKTLGLTRVIIAHRPETVAPAPRRLVLNDGGLGEVQEGFTRCANNRSNT